METKMAKAVVAPVALEVPETPSQDSTQVAITPPKYKKEELLQIFDTIMFEGEYREEIVIKNKLRITFVTRSAASSAEITRELDEKKFNLLSSMQEYRALLCICHSLVGYNGKDLTHQTPEARKAFVEKLPTVVVAAISNALVNFDIKTEAALGELDSF